MSTVDPCSLKVGNLIEVEPLFENLDSERIVLQVVKKTKTGVVFEATYFGVVLGTAVYDAVGGWTWE